MSGARALGVLALAAVAGLAATPSQAGSSVKRKPQRRTVEVADNYFAPSKLTVNSGSTISWVFGEAAADVHDVKLVSGPKGVKGFQSLEGAVGYVYRRKLTRPGRYEILCTFHEADGMAMTITVRR